MKTTFISTLFTYIFCLTFAFCEAQNEAHPWQVSLGINVIDVYPTGVSKYGTLFEDFFNVQDHWNLGTTPGMLQVTKFLGKGFSFGGRASYNTITKYGNQSAEDPYYNADGIIKYNWNQLLKTDHFAPYFELGGGYAIFDAVGAGYFNLGAGIEYWFGEEKRTGVVLGSLFRNTGETYGIKHFQHHVSVAYRFGNRDNDNDGVVNRVDQCPEVPGLAQLNGCPDTDEDGIPDSKDVCPELWGIEEFKGCPDSDGDGIEDALDACVDRVGTPENKGCPEEVKEQEGPRDPDSWDVYEIKIIFFDTDKATLKYESLLTLNEVARILHDFPSFNLKIKGHTDSRASDTYNQELSERRALAAKNYLIIKNIDPSRLETVGCGEAEPARSNDSDQGKAYNRRVEFIIVK